MTGTTHRYRIASPIRFFIFILICVISTIMLIYGVLNIGTSEASAYSTYKEVEIESGDTLWDIASKYSDGKSDVRNYINDICEINDIQASDLEAGDTIFVPIS